MRVRQKNLVKIYKTYTAPGSRYQMWYFTIEKPLLNFSDKPKGTNRVPNLKIYAGLNPSFDPNVCNVPEQQCRTPNGDAGTCILLETCDPLNDINSKEKKSPDDLLFLRQSGCGLFMNIKPKVKQLGVLGIGKR